MQVNACQTRGDFDMKICKNVYQIKIDFYVTPEIKRFVYVYLITGKFCYLIDSGVAGCEQLIGDYMKELGRDILEIKGIFLTHAHPDHIGGAAEIKNLTGCKVYASALGESWIEDIDVQFKERPIPNFYTLVNSSVNIDQLVKDGDSIYLEPELSIDVLETAGHSLDSVAYIIKELNVIFSGDAIPASNDIPIFVDVEESLKSLKKIKDLNSIQFCCPAWDRVYENNILNELMNEKMIFLKMLKDTVLKIDIEYSDADQEQKETLLCSLLNINELKGNPLFKASIKACKLPNK